MNGIDEQTVTGTKKQLTPKEVLTLFLVMLKIGCTCFGGGWSIVAQMDEEFVQKRHWTTSDNLMNCAVMAKGIPGIMIMNASVIFSYGIAGWVGAIVSVVGCALPSIFIILLLSTIYNSFSSNPYVIKAMMGVRASVTAIVASVCIKLGKMAIIDVKTVFVSILVLLACFTSINKALLVIVAVGAGVADFLITRRKSK